MLSCFLSVTGRSLCSKLFTVSALLTLFASFSLLFLLIPPASLLAKLLCFNHGHSPSPCISLECKIHRHPPRGHGSCPPSALQADSWPPQEVPRPSTSATWTSAVKSARPSMSTISPTCMSSHSNLHFSRLTRFPAFSRSWPLHGNSKIMGSREQMIPSLSLWK